MNKKEPKELKRAVLKNSKRSFKGCMSKRIGKFRVIYEILNDFVVFHAFEHRKRVYKR